MTIKEYINEVLWGRVDFDNSFWYQCVDLVRDYVKKVYNHTLGRSGWSAKSWYWIPSSFPNWKKVKNDPTQKDLVPKIGDIVFFDWGDYWHVGVCTETYGNANLLQVLEQNGGNGNGDGLKTNAIRLKTYKYTSNGKMVGKVLGWYTPDKKQEEEKKENKISLVDLNNLEEKVKSLLEDVQKLKNKI